MSSIVVTTMCMYMYMHVHAELQQPHVDYAVWLMQERKVLAAQNIAMQCFVRLCSTLGDTLVVRQATVHVHVCSAPCWLYMYVHMWCSSYPRVMCIKAHAKVCCFLCGHGQFTCADIQYSIQGLAQELAKDCHTCTYVCHRFAWYWLRTV